MPVGFNNSKWKVGMWFGIPIYIDIAFIVLVALCMISTGAFVGGLLFAVAIAFSIVAHELGHSLIARAFGYPTISITLSALGGCASLEDIPRIPLQEILVAAAGPAVSFFLGVNGIVLAHIVRETSLFGSLSSNFGWLNIILGTFNLLPGFPMDGGRILRAALSHFLRNRSKATWWAMKVGRATACVFGVVGALLVLTRQATGVSLLLVAWFIWKAGEQEYLNSLYHP